LRREAGMKIQMKTCPCCAEEILAAAVMSAATLFSMVRLFKD
jgi:hypothetical protein